MRPPAVTSFRKSRGCRAVAAALASGLAAAGVAAAPAAGSAVKASTSPCRTANLVVWFNTNGNGAAGTVFYKLNFTNLGSQSCTLRGYPGVSAVSLAGRQLGSAATRNNVAKVKTITIGTGKTASATVGIVEAGNFPSSSCGLTTAAGLKVFPPNQGASRTVWFPFAACSKKGPKYLTIQAVR